MAEQVPVDAKGNFPVNAALVTMLAIGFVLFNQLLAWGLMVLMAGQGRARVAAVCAFVSLGSGAFVVLTTGREQLRAGGGLRFVDGLVAAVVILLFAVGVALGAPGFGVAGNGLLLGWCFRGFLKKKRTGKPDVTV